MIPNLRRYLLIATFALAGLATPTLAQRMPRENVVHVAAIQDGLCVSNVFQSNMVLQRDKPIKVWGWADSGRTSHGDIRRRPRSRPKPVRIVPGRSRCPRCRPTAIRSR